MKQSAYPVRKGQILEVDVTGYTSEGQGVARVEGLAVFVAGAIRGERVKIKIVHLGHTAAYGEIVEILRPSPHRRTPDCPYAADCGGCVFWHMDYEEELRAKAQRVADALTRIGGLDFPQVPITPGPSVTGYRNKAQYPVALVRGKAQAGFFRQRTHEVIPVERCLIQGPEADQARETVIRWMRENHVPAYDEKTGKGLLRHIYVRTARATGQVLVCLVINGDGIPQEKQLVHNLLTDVKNWTTVCLSIHKKPGNAVLGDKFVTIHGPGYIEDVLCGLRFRLSPRSFYQVNRDQAERLYETAIDLAGLTGRETVLDLYCGTGTITLALAKKAKRVIGVEIIPAAIRDARENAARNAVENAEFFCADASQAAKQFAQTGIRPDVIVVDPPRKGLDETVVDAMAQMSPEKIVYVSCDPATLARDLRRLETHGYRTQTAQALDMFPRCAHVETVVLLSKGEVDSKKIRVEFSLENMDMSEFQDGATYTQIKNYVLEHSGLKVSNLYISQIKRKCGIEVGKNYNLPKSEDSRQPQCPPEKEKAIREAFKYFGMI